MTARVLTARAAAVAGGALLALSPLTVQAAQATPPTQNAPSTHTFQTSQTPRPAQTAPVIAAKGASLVDGATGTSLFGKEADTVRPIASTAKIMAASVVLDTQGVDLERKVPVKQEYRDFVTQHGSSTADLQTGDKLTVRQLLYAALLPSGADAAYALADTFGTGSTNDERTASFIAQMNQKAGELGLSHTKFDSFDGAGTDASTPNELVRLARHAMQNDTFRTVVKTKQYKGEAPAANGRTRYYTWNNTNQLLGSYDGVIGIKTGTTTPAGDCLVFAATRGDKTLYGTVLNSKDRYADAAKLLDHGFGTTKAKTLKLRTLPANAQRD
ncbi:D-alanyl-D-alanine carboxypeptidase [Streptomyces chrestomyceticus JCM 4735]|uniref:D-alanyl-D-alanine carboxypeptidase n=1 Tax=Streptomyces chrestomyceticus JCM 4735 TaxID=1306181 RepID=A0A7U9PXM5_9ACTN|nr:serine hydrolase [Streptomyces chrestomyceticus]GCD36532.1 D-alanyl-D-alanine carboxypeptidase [Streptomyces chrestomyceticus JCM 4735]